MSSTPPEYDKLQCQFDCCKRVADGKSGAIVFSQVSQQVHLVYMQPYVSYQHLNEHSYKTL